MNYFASVTPPPGSTAPAITAAFHTEVDQERFISQDPETRKSIDPPEDRTGFRHALWTKWPHQIAGWVRQD